MSRALPVGISLQIHTSYYGLIPRVRLYPRLRFAAELEMDATRALAEVLPPASLKELGLTNQRPVFDSPADCCHSTRRTYASGGWLAASHGLRARSVDKEALGAGERSDPRRRAAPRPRATERMRDAARVLRAAPAGR